MKINFSALERFSIKDLPANLAFLYQGAARGDVLQRVEFSLLVFEDSLINTATGEYRDLRLDGEVSRAEALAQAARDLIPSGHPSPSVLLLLPPTDFVGTSYSMGVSGEKLVRSALQLQAHSLIPAYEAKLLLGVDARRSEGVALWYPTARIDALFEAFGERGLFLAALMPRSLALLPEDGAQRLLISDEDERHATAMLMEDGAILRLLTVSRRDLEQDEFARQWTQALAQLRDERGVGCSKREDWTRLRRKIPSQPAYSFLPEGSLREGRRIEAVKRRKVAAGLAAAAVFALCLPFIGNWMEIRRLEGRLENFMVETTRARELQDAVLAMEEEWGALYEYPRQDVVQVLRALNNVIEGSLQQFSIDRGVIDIAGSSADTASLVNQLAELEEFYNVTQSRTVTSDRFGIRMNLSGADFEGYQSKYGVAGN